MKNFVYLLLVVTGLSSSFVYGLDQEEKEYETKQDIKNIEQKEWEQKQYDWWQEKRKIDQGLDAKDQRRRELNTIQSKKLDQKKADDKAWDRQHGR